MRYLILIFFCGLSHIILAQDLFDYVRQHDFKAVKDYSGAVNLRDPNQATPLMWAVFSADRRMVRKLIRKGADPTLKGWIIVDDTLNHYQLIYGSCLAIAAGKKKNRLLKYFIRRQDLPVDDREINLDHNTEDGWTALQWASLVGNLEGAEFLIHRGADVNAIAPTNYNQTPLHLAVGFNQTEMVSLLIREGADCQATDLLGTSVLSYAFENESREIVKILLAAGAHFAERENKVLEDELHKTFGVDDVNEL